VLSTAAGRAAGRPPAARGRAVAAALAPTARVAHGAAAALTAVVASAPAVVVAARGETAASAAEVPVIVACLVGGAAVGWAVEDPAAEVLAPLPLAPPVRTALRVVSVAAVAAIGLSLTLVVTAAGPGWPAGLHDRLAETAAAAAVALAAGLVAARRGERGSGPIGVTAGILATACVAALAYRWPTVLPTFAAGPTHDRWWVLAAVGVAVAGWAGRDPGRR
jgi:hypothetical protein